MSLSSSIFDVKEKNSEDKVLTISFNSVKFRSTADESYIEIVALNKHIPQRVKRATFFKYRCENPEIPFKVESQHFNLKVISNPALE